MIIYDRTQQLSQWPNALELANEMFFIEFSSHETPKNTNL